MAMFRDPEVKAVMAARGGYGSGRLLPHIDIERIGEQPKIFVGYSDLTFLLNRLVQDAGASGRGGVGLAPRLRPTKDVKIVPTVAPSGALHKELE